LYLWIEEPKFNLIKPYKQLGVASVSMNIYLIILKVGVKTHALIPLIDIKQRGQ